MYDFLGGAARGSGGDADGSLQCLPTDPTEATGAHTELHTNIPANHYHQYR